MQLRHEVTMTERFDEATGYGFDIVAELVCDVDPAIPEYRWKGTCEVSEWNPKNVIVYDNAGNVIPLQLSESVIDEQGNEWLDENEEKIKSELWDVYKRENEYHDH